MLVAARMRKELSTDEVFLTEMNEAIALLKKDHKLRAKVLDDNIAALSVKFEEQSQAELERNVERVR